MAPAQDFSERETSSLAAFGLKSGMAGTGAARTPPKPDSVPEQASWHPERREWLAGVKDEQGRWHQWVIGFSEVGVKCSLQHFRAGVADGAFTRFHPNGEVARRGEFVKGKPHGDWRAERSHEPTTERLRTCCVPPQAWSLVSRYDHGRLIDEWFENEAGQALSSDGSLRPERPDSVHPRARFDETSRRWCLGAYDAAGLRDGLWQWWWEAGARSEEVHYRAGKRWGVAQSFYKTGALASHREFVEDVLSGAASEPLVQPGLYADAGIASWRGKFDSGQPAGSWVFSDHQGQVLYERDFGSPCLALPLEHPVLGPRRDRQSWEHLAQELETQGQVGLALCAAARAAVLTEPVDARAVEFNKRLTRAVVPLSVQESQRRAAELERLRIGSGRSPRPTREVELASWVQGLVAGMDPALVFDQLASLLLSRPSAGVDFSELSVALAPQRHTFCVTRALLRFELGQPAAALQDLSRLEQAQSASAQLIADYRRLVFPEFGFWPDKSAFTLPENPELPEQVEQSLGEVQRAFQKSAVRLDVIRNALLEQLETSQPPAWLPPDPRDFCDSLDIELEQYSFGESWAGPGAGFGARSEDPDEPDPGDEDLIQVDERISVEGLGITQLMRLARVEWTCLCWLCWGAGLKSVAFPTELGPCPDYARAMATAFFRVFRVADSLQTVGLRSRSRGLPSVEWEGHDSDTLNAVFAPMAEREAYEMRAVLFWLGDRQCRSLWQDDLRAS